MHHAPALRMTGNWGPDPCPRRVNDTAFCVRGGGGAQCEGRGRVTCTALLHAAPFLSRAPLVFPTTLGGAGIIIAIVMGKLRLSVGRAPPVAAVPAERRAGLADTALPPGRSLTGLVASAPEFSSSP